MQLRLFIFFFFKIICIHCWLYAICIDSRCCCWVFFCCCVAPHCITKVCLCTVFWYRNDYILYEFAKKNKSQCRHILQCINYGVHSAFRHYDNQMHLVLHFAEHKLLVSGLYLYVCMNENVIKCLRSYYMKIAKVPIITSLRMHLKLPRIFHVHFFLYNLKQITNLTNLIIAQ